MIRGTIEELIKTVQDSARKIDVAEWIKRKGRRKENTKKNKSGHTSLSVSFEWIKRK